MVRPDHAGPRVAALCAACACCREASSTRQTAGLEASCNLKYGNHNVAVLRLQDDLNYCYGPSGKVAHLFSPALSRNSDYGPATQGAAPVAQRRVLCQADDADLD